MPVLLEAGALTVRRGRRTVLSGVGLTLDSGRAIHLAGPNGSGKTSLLRVLAGLAAPRAGTVRRHGTCAFVPEKVGLAPAMRAGEWLRAMRALRGLNATDWATAAEASGLDAAVLERPAMTFSRGMLQRIALLEALHAGCPLLLLDEPFSGLDDDGRAWLSDEVSERLDGGAAVLLTDHSGASAGRVPIAEVLHLRDGTAHATRAPRVADHKHEATLTVRAVHPDGRRVERTVSESAGDALLRALLADGWHVEEVRRRR